MRTFLFITMSLLVMSLGVFINVPRTIDSVLVNANPFKIEVSTQYAHYQLDEPLSLQTQGWFTLEPGDSVIVPVSVAYGQHPHIAVYGRSAEPAVTSFLYGVDSHELVEFRSTDLLSPGLVQEEEILSFSHSHPFSVSFFRRQLLALRHLLFDLGISQDSLLFAAPETLGNVNYSEGTQVKPFLPLPVKRQGLGFSSKVRYVFASQGFQNLHTSSRKNDFSNEALQTRQAIYRAKEFFEKFPETENYPFTLGLTLADPYELDRQGVTVSKVASAYDVYGKSFNIKPGDRLLSLNQKRIRSEADIYLELYDHGRDFERGIEKPLQWQIIRNDAIITEQSAYFFSVLHFPYNKNEEKLAYRLSMWESVLLGCDFCLSTAYQLVDKVLGKANENLSFSQRNTLFMNNFYRLRCLYPEAVLKAQKDAIPLPTPLELIPVAGWGIKAGKIGIASLKTRRISKLASLGIVSGVESSIQHINSASILLPQDELITQLPTVIQQSVAGGVVFGYIFSSKKSISNFQFPILNKN